MREQHFFGASLKMRFAISARAIDAGAVQHHIHIEFTPRQIGNGCTVQNAQGIATHPHYIALLADIESKTAMTGIVFEQVRHTGGFCQLVNRDHSDLCTSARFIQRAQDVASNPAKTIYRYPYRHFSPATSD